MVKVGSNHHPLHRMDSHNDDLNIRASTNTLRPALMLNANYSAPGRDVFRYMCWVNFFLLNLAGVSFFSTVITEEKEEMTLGLLRMAGISPVGILLGKVTPRLLGVVLLLSVQLPFTILAITLGGVAINQILAAYVALLAFAVLMAGLGAFL